MYKLKDTATKARKTAVQNNKTTISAAGDHDQVTLALLKTLNHPDI